MPSFYAFNPSVRSMKCLFFKSPNLTLFHHSHSTHNNRRLRVADILLADEHDAAVDSMDDVPQPPLHASTRSIKCYSPRRLVSWLLAALTPSKQRQFLKRRQMRQSSSMMIELNDGDEGSRQLNWNDTSFKVGVGCGLLYVIAATKNELSKMVELRKEMEINLQNMKAELQSKDTLLNPLKQSDDDAVVCSITDIQEVSCSNSHLSVHTQIPYIQPEFKSNLGSNRYLDCKTSEQEECAEEINELQAEFEYELQRLQLYLDGEAAFEDAQQEMVEVAVNNDSSSKSQSSSFGEIIMEPQGASYDTSFGVPPVELERRLHELLEARLQERIIELEDALEYATQKLNEKEIKVTWWEETARLTPYHDPETCRFTFPLDPEVALKFSRE
ncbi:protein POLARALIZATION DURING ASYMMETRIC DIVISION AND REDISTRIBUTION [Cicer arietinum]|uniref:Protein POLAR LOCALIZATION DURING ASYMMETRIC DIVISION AND REDISTRIBUTION n=1 Tax=Cicer arietinum TaxID=3827 RepID=A0A1S2YAU3_CICAR|nr:protein POLAR LOCALIZATION DURING ASYMMETRIC DIVISION AND REDISTRIBUTION [Cicer arietinum]